MQTQERISRKSGHCAERDSIPSRMQEQCSSYSICQNLGFARAMLADRETAMTGMTGLTASSSRKESNANALMSMCLSLYVGLVFETSRHNSREQCVNPQESGNAGGNTGQMGYFVYHLPIW